MQITPLLAP